MGYYYASVPKFQRRSKQTMSNNMPLFYVDVIEGLTQDCSNSTANALELLQSCAKPS